MPILIGFLASLLGLGGIADKIKKIIETIQKPVMKVVDWVVGKAVALGKKFIGAGEEGRRQDQGRRQEADRARSRRSSASRRRRPSRSRRTRRTVSTRAWPQVWPPRTSFAGKPVAGKILSPLLTAIKLRYRMKSLTLVAEGDNWGVAGEVNPSSKATSRAQGCQG